VSELGELLAEFGIGDGDGPCAASAFDISASVIANRIEFFEFFILFLCDLLNSRELLLEVFDLLFVFDGLGFSLGSMLFESVCSLYRVSGFAFEPCEPVV